MSDRAAFDSTGGCLEHIEHGHNVPGCLVSTPVGVETNTLLIGLTSRIRLAPRA